MYKVLLVDDEDEIRGRIANHLKDVDGFTIVGSTGNGFDALEFLEQNTVDVILSDIKMPFVDGIEMTRQVRTLYPSIKIAFITGYDDFQYAKEAIHLKIEHYLMKPVAPGELREFLARLKTEMDAAVEKKKHATQLRHEYAAIKPTLLEKMLIAYLVYDHFDRRDLSRLQDMGLALPDGASYYGIWLSVPKDSRQDDLYFAIKTFIDTEFKSTPFQQQMVFPDGIFIVQGTPEPGLEMLSEMLSEWTLSIERFFEITPQFLVSRVFPDLYALKKMFTDITFLKQSNAALEENSPIFYDDIASTLKTILFEAEDLTLLKRLFQSSLKALKKFIQDKFEEAERLSLVTLPQLKMELPMTLMHVHSILDQMGHEDLDISPITFQDDTDIEGLKGHFESIIVGWHMAWSRQRDGAVHKLDGILAFVDEHITDSALSLDELSHKFYLSVPYLSKQFKAKTGVTFSRYVTQKRVERAKQLLKKTPSSISQIALDVGYKDVYYFSHAFKKVVGKSPKEYRR